MEQGKTIILRVVTVGDKKDRSDTKREIHECRATKKRLAGKR